LGTKFVNPPQWNLPYEFAQFKNFTIFYVPHLSQLLSLLCYHHICPELLHLHQFKKIRNHKNYTSLNVNLHYFPINSRLQSTIIHPSRGILSPVYGEAKPRPPSGLVLGLCPVPLAGVPLLVHGVKAGGGNHDLWLGLLHYWLRGFYRFFLLWS